MFAKLFRALFGRKKSSDAKEAPVTEAELNDPAELAAQPVTTASATATAEELCGLRDGMTHEELRAQLSKLYRRHNRAASSLNPELRAEAERMLDAIVEIRHRYLELDEQA